MPRLILFKEDLHGEVRMGLEFQKGSERLLGFAPLNRVKLEIPYGPIGIIAAPRIRKTDKNLHVSTNFLFVHLNRISSLSQRFSHGKRARAIEAGERMEITDQVLRRVYTLPEGRQQRTFTDGVSMQKRGLKFSNEPPFMFWQF